MKLIKLNEGRYRVVDANFTFEGKWSDVFDVLHEDMAIGAEDIVAATDCMEKHEHKVAVFGVSYSFIATQPGDDTRSSEIRMRVQKSLSAEYGERGKVLNFKTRKLDS